MGANLKIGRPSKYSGPITTATSWSEVLLNLGADTVDWSSPAALVLKAGGVDTSLLTLEHNASKRELFIANVQPESSDLTLRAFLETLIAQAETAIHTGDIIKSLRLSGTHAFLEAQSSCHASALLSLDRVPFRGHRLKISRPTRHVDASADDDGESRRTWAETLQEIRCRHGRSEERGLRESEANHNEIRLHRPLSTLKSPQLSPDIVVRLASLTQDPSTMLLLRGALQIARSHAKLTQFMTDGDDPVLRDVLADLRAECTTYGSVRQVGAEDGNLFVEFELLNDAIIAIANLKFRRFCNEPLDVIFYRQPDGPPNHPR